MLQLIFNSKSKKLVLCHKNNTHFSLDDEQYLQIGLKKPIQHNVIKIPINQRK